MFEAIYFNRSEHLPRKIKAIYQVDSNEFNGNKGNGAIFHNIRLTHKCDWFHQINKRLLRRG